MNLLDGKKLAQTIKDELAAEVKTLGIRPHLAAVLVGDNPASKSYVGGKVKACFEVGFESTLVELPGTTSESELLHTIDNLNADPEIHGYIVQLPLPKGISEEKVLLAVDPRKDVDGFHPENVGRMVAGLDCFLPATPQGILTILERYNIETQGLHCVVVGRSHIVGRPISILMSRSGFPGNCTVTLCHSKTTNLREECSRADILITALGKPEYITSEYVKEGAVVIDVGITRVEDPSRKNGFRLTGDVAFDDVAPKCSWITPVPGGVGPMTIVSLLMNTLKAATQHLHLG
jgi:methylenetetrahydrofolate dehydrogenase (NADP+)/methenyltetrahydrofolate cyclohydrolase